LNGSFSGLTEPSGAGALGSSNCSRLEAREGNEEVDGPPALALLLLLLLLLLLVYVMERVTVGSSERRGGELTERTAAASGAPTGRPAAAASGCAVRSLVYSLRSLMVFPHCARLSSPLLSLASVGWASTRAVSDGEEVEDGAETLL
jgi:hypothetical protein